MKETPLHTHTYAHLHAYTHARVVHAYAHSPTGAFAMALIRHAVADIIWVSGQ